MLQIYDTHAHYDDPRFDADRDAVLSGLPDRGIAYVNNIGCDMPSSRASVALAEKYPFVYAAVGVHPHEADSLRQQDLDELRQLLQHSKVRALGEIGLDYHYDNSPRDIQRQAFHLQMELAEETGMPVVIHEREATRDCLEVIRSHRPCRGVFHCYSGSIETARELLDRGYFISFTGVITFANANRVREVVRFIPDDRIMVETDCPYLSPVPCRGKRCDSSMLHYTLSTLADIRGITAEQAAALTMRNSKAFFAVE